MAMRISEPGDHRAAVKIDCACSVKFSCVIVRTNEENPPAFDQDRLGLRLFFVNGVNISVEKQKVRIVIRGVRREI